MKRDIVLIAMFSMLVSAFAQNKVDRLVLQDGSVLNGYIETQILGKELVFVSEESFITINDTKNVWCTPIDKGRLSAKWQKWAQENKNLIMSPDGSLALSALHVEKETISPVYVLESGAEIKYVYLEERRETIPLSKIKYVVRIPVSDSIINKTTDVIETKNASSYRGVIVSMEPGKTFRIKDGNGMIQVIPFSDVRLERKEKNSKKMFYYDQSPYIETIVLKPEKAKDKKERYRGVIIERNYEKGFLTIYDEKDYPEVVQLSDIKEIHKEVNEKYKPIYLFTIDDSNKLYVNRNEAKYLPVSLKDSKSNVYAIEVEQKCDSCITELKSTSSKTKVEIESLDTKENRDIIVFKLRVQEQKKDKMIYRFSSESFMDDMCSSIEKVTIDETNILTVTYELPVGTYAIYRKSDKKCALLRIK